MIPICNCSGDTAAQALIMPALAAPAALAPSAAVSAVAAVAAAMTVEMAAVGVRKERAVRALRAVPCGSAVLYCSGQRAMQRPLSVRVQSGRWGAAAWPEKWWVPCQRGDETLLQHA
eukprot:jgi/Ulvmu1/10642/UM066_0022.1